MRRTWIVSISLILVIALVLLAYFLYENDDHVSTVPNLLSYAGKGWLIHSEDGKSKQLNSSIEYFADLPNKKMCEGFLLSSKEDASILAITHCEPSTYVLCSGGFQYCANGEHTKKTKNIIQYISDFSGSRYRVEFLSNEIIFKIQEPDCLVPYPHGCIVNGWGWEDLAVYRFIKERSN